MKKLKKKNLMGIGLMIKRKEIVWQKDILKLYNHCNNISSIKNLEDLTLEEYKWFAPRFALGLKANAVATYDGGYEMYTLTVAFLPGSGVS